MNKLKPNAGGTLNAKNIRIRGFRYWHARTFHYNCFGDKKRYTVLLIGCRYRDPYIIQNPLKILQPIFIFY